MSDFTSSHIPCIPHPLMYEKKDDLYLLLHSQRPIWTVVNRLGFEIASLCDGKHTVQDTATYIADHYCQDLETIHADVVAYLAQLEQTGFLSNENDGTSENKPDLTREQLARAIRLHIYVTESCNLHCIHCAVTDDCPKTDMLSTSEIYHLLDELDPEAGDSVTISGGEPLLRKDCLDILRYASRRVRTCLTTNAALVDESTAAALAELDILLQISLDGSSPTVHDRIRGKGAFHKTMRAVEMLHEHGFAGELMFSLIVMKPNIADALNVIDLAEQMGIDISLAPLFKMGRAQASWSELCLTPDEFTQLCTYIYKEMPHAGRKARVGAGLPGFNPNVAEQGVSCTIGQVAAVDGRGDVYPCPFLMSPDFYLGNVKQISLRQIMASPKLHELAASCAARKTRIEECRHCNWRNFCQAGCPASVLLEKGTMLETDDLCEVRRYLYRETLFDLAAHKLKLDDIATESVC